MSKNEPGGSSPSMELPFLKPLEPTSFPDFPTLAQLAEVPEQEAKKETSLFDGLLGDVGALHDDMVRHPEKYDRRTSELLTQLASGSLPPKNLTPEERRLLDMAVMDYAQAPRPRAPGPARANQQPKKAPAKKRADPVPGRDVPVTELPPYWWLR